MSRAIHVEAMCWLRYGKRLPIVCTEVGFWNADVLGVSDKMSVEVEIKVSKADLLRDFTSKKQKHWVYANARDEQGNVPNYFYFFVPESLGEKAQAILEEKAPKVGLAVHTETGLIDGRNVRILRKATKLRNGKPTPRLLQTALQRMSSELCGTKIIVDRLRGELLEKFDAMSQGVVLASARAAGALDADQFDDLEQRAAEMAFCVEQKLWSEVENKDKWRMAATRWLEAQYLHNRDWTNEAYRFAGPRRRAPDPAPDSD